MFRNLLDRGCKCGLTQSPEWNGFLVPEAVEPSEREAHQAIGIFAMIKHRLEERPPIPNDAFDRKQLGVRVAQPE
jgi:hypothetical protein